MSPLPQARDYKERLEIEDYICIYLTNIYFFFIMWTWNPLTIICVSPNQFAFKLQIFKSKCQQMIAFGPHLARCLLLQIKLYGYSATLIQLYLLLQIKFYWSSARLVHSLTHHPRCFLATMANLSGCNRSAISLARLKVYRCLLTLGPSQKKAANVCFLVCLACLHLHCIVCPSVFILCWQFIGV